MQRFAPTVLSFDALESTNDYLKTKFDTLPEFTVCWARYQHSGRGRREHHWESEAGKNLLFSILIKTDIILDDMMRLVTDCLICLLESYQIHAKVKVPNDLMVNQRKIAGILIERLFETRYLATIIGIGLNVNQTEFVSENATSMAIETHQDHDLSALLTRILDIFCQNWESNIDNINR